MKIAMIGGRGLPETYSGVEVFLKELGPRLVSRGHEVIVYCRPELFHDHGYKGVKLVRVPSVRTRRLGTMTHSVVSTLRAVRDRADIFHFNAVGPAALSVIPKFLRLPSVATMHSLNWKHSKWSRAEKMAIKAIAYGAIHAPDSVVAVSMQHQEYLQATYRSPICHVPNGVNVTPRVAACRILDLGLVPDNYILYVGRLSPEKGTHYLMDAFSRLNTTHQLVIAGDSPNEPDYVRDLKATAGDRVLFLGHVSSALLSELYSHASIYVLPSESEGLSISLLEAMSFECCVVTSAIRENLDVISDCGVSFEPGNTVMLTETLAALLLDPPARKALGRRAKHHVQQLYNWEDICTQYETLYKTIHHRSGQPAVGPCHCGFTFNMPGGRTKEVSGNSIAPISGIFPRGIDVPLKSLASPTSAP